ncbi:unnamed protein product [Lota lota]
MKRRSTGILPKGVKQICVEGSNQPTTTESVTLLHPLTQGRPLHPAALPKASTPGRSRPTHPADRGHDPLQTDQEDFPTLTPYRTPHACQSESVSDAASDTCSSESGDDSQTLPGPRSLATNSSDEEVATPTFGSGQCHCESSGPTTCYSSICDLDLPCPPLNPEAGNMVLPEPSSPVAAKTDVSITLPTPTPTILPIVGKASKPFQPFEVSSGRKRDSLVLKRKRDLPLLATKQITVVPPGAPGVAPPVSMSALAWAVIPDNQVMPFPLNPLVQFHVPVVFNIAAPTPVFFPPVWCLVKAPIQGKAPTPQARLSSKVPPPHQQGAYDLLADFPALLPHNMRPPARSTADQVRGPDGRWRGLAVPPVNVNQQPGDDRCRAQRSEHSEPLVPRPMCAGDQKFTLAQIPPPLAKPGLSHVPVVYCEGAAAHAQPITEADASVGARRTTPRASACADLAKQTAATPEKARGSVTQRMTNANAYGKPIPWPRTAVKGESPAAKKHAACQAKLSSLVANPSTVPRPQAIHQPMTLDFTPPPQTGPDGNRGPAPGFSSHPTGSGLGGIGITVATDRGSTVHGKWLLCLW